MNLKEVRKGSIKSEKYVMVNSIFNKLWKNRWMLRSLPQTIWFNFHYLPFKQALKLPIILYKPKLRKCGGTITITAKEVKTGMIRLGKNTVSIYPNSGIIFGSMGGGRIQRDV